MQYVQIYRVHVSVDFNWNTVVKDSKILINTSWKDLHVGKYNSKDFLNIHGFA